ncbi:MAG: TRAP transporter small permease [Methyloligellaceae bacterium]
MDYRSHYPLPLRWLSNGVDVTLALAGFSIVSLVFINALLRGAAGFDLAWSLEVTAFLLLWSTFLGCSAAIARGAHMRVTEIVERLFSVRSQRILSIAIDIIIVLIMLSLIKTGFDISAHTWDQKTTVLYWPVGLLYASMPVGIALSLIFHIYNLIHDVRFPTQLEGHHNDGAEDHA